MKKRNCPECNREIIYTNVNSFYRARKLNSLCNHCKQSGSRNSFYGKKFSNRQIKKWKRERSGKGNPMFGTEGGMKGKKQSEYQKKLQSDYMKKRWLKEYGVKRDNWSEFKKYRFEVDRLTKQNPLHILENFDKRGRAGIPGAYHLNHIYSVYNGFKNSIAPEIIAKMENLQMIPWLENQKNGINNLLRGYINGFF